MPSSAIGERPQARFEPRGVAHDLFACRDRELIVEGPAGTGKSLACLHKVNAVAAKYPGSRQLILRKTLVSLTASGLVTFEQKVEPGRIYHARFFGGNAHEPAAYRYPNGSVVVVGGMDNAAKVLSTEYDLIYAQQCEELGEPEWETLTTRMRNGVLPYQQLLGDCNPDAPTHWIKQRAIRGSVRLLLSRHEDNPAYWDAAAQDWTEAGRAYVVGTLGALTGVRYQRLRLGNWVGAEGQIYEEWDEALHVLDPFPIPPAWPRYLAIDFGYTNPFVCQWWAEDPDGRLYCYRELYRTQRLVEDHAADIKRLSAGEPRPRAIICDHDAEGRATLVRKLGATTTAATKAVLAGIEAVALRLRKAGDGRPRLFFLRDALVNPERDRINRGLPCATVQEFPRYVWDSSASRKRGEEPLKEHDHGMDALRYMVMQREATRPYSVASGARPALLTGGNR